MKRAFLEKFNLPVASVQTIPPQVDIEISSHDPSFSDMLYAFEAQRPLKASWDHGDVYGYLVKMENTEFGMRFVLDISKTVHRDDV